MSKEGAAYMIPVTLQAEPSDFDTNVRQSGFAWLRSNGIDPNNPPPKASDLPAYWQRYTKQLWDAYSGVCAYLAIFFEFSTGAASTDHFIAKSQNAGKAYEWDNYRLSCLGANRNKNKFDDVLDPIGLAPETLFLNLVNGAIFPNPLLTVNQKNDAINTINRLELDSPDNRRWRAARYSYYLNNDWSLNILEQLAPFVHYEIIRQGLI
jgi:uncharacterized protein (TIGR02646 family)